MRVLIVSAQVPFTRGGQDSLVASLEQALRLRSVEVDTVSLPFSLETKGSVLDQIALWRSLSWEDFAGKKVDLVVCTKFPTYFARHPKKVVWLVHQHRPALELLGTRFSDFSDDPRDEAVRRLVVEEEYRALAECSVITAISQTVVRRLNLFFGLDAICLYPPLPLGSRYRCEGDDGYILSVGRILGIKRIDFLVKALPMVHHTATVTIVGQPDEPGVMDYLENEIKKHHLEHRVTFRGRVSDEELLSLYGRARAVYYAPFDEDYGFSTLEAFASSKPVLTATDSGGTLEFVRDGETGVVVEPTYDAIAQGLNRFVENPDAARKMGERGRARVVAEGLFDTAWDRVIDTLVIDPLT